MYRQLLPQRYQGMSLWTSNCTHCHAGTGIEPLSFTTGGHSTTYKDIQQLGEGPHMIKRRQVCSENEYMRYGYDVKFSLKH